MLIYDLIKVFSLTIVMYNPTRSFVRFQRMKSLKSSKSIYSLITTRFQSQSIEKLSEQSKYIYSNSLNTSIIHPHRFSVAPMMDYTDKYQRYLSRLMSKHAILYTEMVTANAIVHKFKENKMVDSAEVNDPIEDPVVIQLGGSDPELMKEAAKIVTKEVGYKEINLNVGCPSEKVAGKGCFGARLMLDPELVTQLVIAIGEGSAGGPVTVKCRIGVDDKDSYEELCHFIDTVSNKGRVNHFIVHARKAILNANFSPDDNRKIPPLKYDYVYKLVKDFPSLTFTINGGVNSVQEAKAQLDQGVHGVMVGRSIINNPFEWRNVDSELYQTTSPGLSRRQILKKYAEYAKKIEAKGDSRVRRALIKPLWNLFAGEPYTKQFKMKLESMLQQTSLSRDGINISDIIQIAAFENGIKDSILDRI